MVTVIIPVKNEGVNIAICLKCLRDLGPAIVVDSGSTDNTVAVAEQEGADVLRFRWDGRFPKKRNWVLRHYDFQTDWVLFLDADEFVPESFVKEVHSVLPDTPHVGFWLNFENHFMGRKLRGGDHFRKLALFRVGAGEYERIDECSWSDLDMEVHEHPILKGSIGEIKTPIQHNDYRGLRHYIAKHNEYSEWEANRYLKLMRGGTQDHTNLTDRQQAKYRNLAKWWFAPAYFAYTYLWKRGFLDGRAGLHFALMKAIYFYHIRLKIIEKEHMSAD